MEPAETARFGGAIILAALLAGPVRQTRVRNTRYLVFLNPDPFDTPRWRPIVKFFAQVEPLGPSRVTQDVLLREHSTNALGRAGGAALHRLFLCGRKGARTARRLK